MIQVPSHVNLVSELIPELSHYQDYLHPDLRAAVVGFGKMGVLHGTILNLLIPNSVAAVVERNRILNFAVSKLMKNVRFYRDIEKMLKKEEPSVVYVTTPAQSHCSVVRCLLEAGVKCIFVEKPPTRTSNELASLIDAMSPSQQVMVGFQKRFALPFRHARMLLSNSVLGDLERVSCWTKSSDVLSPTQRYDGVGRGVLLDVGVHLLDLLVWIFGDMRIKKASCVSVHTRVDDSFKAMLASENAIMVVFEAAWSSAEHRLPETVIEVHGSNGVLTVAEDRIRVTLREEHRLLGNRSELVMYRPQYYQDFPPVNVADPEYAIEDLHLLFSIHSSAEPLTSLRNSAQVMELVDGLYARVNR